MTNYVDFDVDRAGTIILQMVGGDIDTAIALVRETRAQLGERAKLTARNWEILETLIDWLGEQDPVAGDEDDPIED